MNSCPLGGVQVRHCPFTDVCVRYCSCRGVHGKCCHFGGVQVRFGPCTGVQVKCRHRGDGKVKHWAFYTRPGKMLLSGRCSDKMLPS